MAFKNFLFQNFGNFGAENFGRAVLAGQNCAKFGDAGFK
jgi:hypothetical protein